MPSDLASYLAENYLVADPKPKSKKRKRKDAEAQGLLITDDDETGWSKSASNSRPGLHDQVDDVAAVSGTSAEFRRAKQSGWKTVGVQPAPRKTAEDAAADAILASAAAENEAARQADDEMPVVEGEEGVTKMSDGTHAGLQSGAAVAAQLKRRQREEREEFERYRKSATEQETIYRDATGRRVDVSMKRAEARRAAAEAEEKERKAKEALKGDVQIEEARKRKEQLEDARFMSLARKVDDEDLNREQKGAQRWNDPMAQFMSETKVTQGSTTGKGKAGVKSRRPVYEGAATPNRYGIRPGYRWDGVDRGNGFEAERFKAINRRERNKGLEYSWQMDE